MVLAVKIGLFHFFLAHAQSLGIDFAQAALQAFYLFHAALQVLLVAVTPAAHTVQHQTGIFAHFYGLAAKGYHTGHAGGYAIHINADVGLAMAQGVEYRNAAVHFPAVAVDSYMDAPAHAFGFHQFLGYAPALHLRIVSDVPVQEYRTGAVVTRCNIEKSAHRHVFTSGFPAFRWCENRTFPWQQETASAS